MDSKSDSTSTTSSSTATELYNLHTIDYIPAVISHKRSTGRKKFKETRHPIYRGVRHRNGCKWVCEIRELNKKSRIWLGTHTTPEMAARAYDVAALALRGKFAPLNFPDSAWLLPRPKSSSAEDVKSAAFQAARAYRPTKVASASSASLTSSISSTAYVKLQRVQVLDKLLVTSRMFWDEEAMMDMPSLLDSMAEGLLLPPPRMHEKFDWVDVDLSLWSD
ncbi:hypothetical protein IFM89_002110 [Coptis chinensis]|uniref:AP2/ERF domain-containing protein n=1 Tax=Coptis chinensis TaxID=261450 RepID=A0A835H0Q1_9MAGN|nr:hypothetical protein IFM89_002110 [Coptis chinensis]